MRVSAMVLIAAALPQAVAAQAPPAPEAIPSAQPVGTMSELMIQIIYPYSDAIFYISTRTPSSSAEWTDLEGKTLMLAESANLLMTPERAWDGDQWMRDARLLLDARQATFRAAKERNVEALEELNDQLYQSCVTCHQHYRPGYGRRP